MPRATHSVYKLDMLPDEARLRFDLQTIIRAYRALTYRGGVDADIEGQSNVADDFALTRQMSITETRKYAYHRKVERNSTAARYAKKCHGNRCQACGLNFAERHGDIGAGFNEVHHLRPISWPTAATSRARRFWPAITPYVPKPLTQVQGCGPVRQTGLRLHHIPEEDAYRPSKTI